MNKQLESKLEIAIYLGGHLERYKRMIYLFLNDKAN